MSNLVTVKELALILAVSTDTVYAKASNGDIPVVRVGRALRFDPEAVKAKLTAVPEDPWAMSPRSRAAKRTRKRAA